MNRLLPPILGGIALLSSCAAPPPPAADKAAPAEVKILENLTLIDGTGKDAVADAALVIADGKITYAGPKSGAPSPAGAVRVDLSGKFVMPGIINLHGHLGNVKGVKQDQSFYTRENLDKQLATYARYGVTTVVSMGSDIDLIFGVREKQRSGRNTQTRVYTAGRGFTGVDGYPSTMAGMKGVPFEVSQVAEVEKDVAELVAKKVDLVKIWVDDHLGKEKKISIPLCTAIIENARKNGLKVAAHVFYYDDARRLSEAGLHAFAHSVRDKPVDQALIDTAKKSGTWQIPTFTREVSTFTYATPPKFLKDEFFLKGADPEAVAGVQAPEFMARQANDKNLPRYSAFLKTAQQNLKKLADAGVSIGFGTDTGPPGRFSGYFEHMEMELMAEAGLTPKQIVQSFSGNAARYLGASDIGTLEAGRWADLVVLGKNPLDDIRNARTIEQVMISGTKVD
jgi:imidazolonepropionase-like amidohydrolase